MLKAIYGVLAGMGIVGVILMFCIPFALIGISLYGLILAFSANVLLGIVVLFVEPMPLIIGLAKLFAGIDLAQRILEFFTQ